MAQCELRIVDRHLTSDKLVIVLRRWDGENGTVYVGRFHHDHSWDVTYQTEPFGTVHNTFPFYSMRDAFDKARSLLSTSEIVA